MNDLDPEAQERQRHFGLKLRRVGIAAAVGAVLLAAGGIVMRLHAQTQVRQWTEDQAVPTVDIVTPKAASDQDELVLPGTLRAYFDAPIYARVSGYLKRWNVDIGANVHAGEVLAEIETPEVDQQLRQAQAELATAKANEQLAAVTAERWRNMLASQSVSKQEADEKAGDYAARQSILASAQANVDRLRAMTAFKRVVAPFDGIVTARNTDVGALINAGGGGQELFRVADEHAARVYVDVPQTYAAEIHPGMSAELVLPERPDGPLAAKVGELSQAIREASRTMQVELLADNRDGLLLPGKYVDVHFKLTTPKSLLQLPTTALLFRQEGLRVATVDAQNHVVLKVIRLARERGAVVDVSDGLTATDRVIDSPPDAVENGDEVQPAAPVPAHPTAPVARS
jgi:RND family efflux transporter MFP subunit